MDISFYIRAIYPSLLYKELGYGHGKGPVCGWVWRDMNVCRSGRFIYSGIYHDYLYPALPCLKYPFIEMNRGIVGIPPPEDYSFGVEDIIYVAGSPVTEIIFLRLAPCPPAGASCSGSYPPVEVEKYILYPLKETSGSRFSVVNYRLRTMPLLQGSKFFPHKPNGFLETYLLPLSVYLEKGSLYPVLAVEPVHMLPSLAADNSLCKGIFCTSHYFCYPFPLSIYIKLTQIVAVQ